MGVVANAILYLLSEASSYIAGAEIPIDGGLSIHFQPGGLGVPEKLVKDDPEPELI